MPKKNQSRLLTPSERERFVRYLEESADSLELTVHEMEAYSGGRLIAPLKRKEIAAYRFVANIIRDVEDAELSPPPRIAR